jgi:hypothetical protein
MVLHRPVELAALIGKVDSAEVEKEVGWSTLNALRRSWVPHLFGIWFIRGCGVYLRRMPHSRVFPGANSKGCPCYPAPSKPLKIILDIRDQYAIMILLIRHDSSHCPQQLRWRGCPSKMLARHAVLLTSSKSSPPATVTFSPTARSSNSFSCNTYGFLRKCCKQKTYTMAKSFRCNTYKKQGAPPSSQKPSLPTSFLRLCALCVSALQLPIPLSAFNFPACKCASGFSATSHSPYTLPSSVSCKSFACHSYENCRGGSPRVRARGTPPPLRWIPT